MTQKPSWMKPAHRILAGIIISVLVVLLLLNLSGIIAGMETLCIFLMVEVPLLLVYVMITILRFRAIRNGEESGTGDFFERLAAEEPLLRPAISEFRAFQSLFFALGKKRNIPQGAFSAGYTKGTMSLPVVFAVLLLIEVVAVHILVPWLWLEIVLLVVTIYGALFMFGVLASRIVHPHFITAETLHLRWGHRVVLVTPLANVVSVALYANYAHSQPQVEGDVLVLTQFRGTNVRIEFMNPVTADAPGSKKRHSDHFHAAQAHLYVDDPEAFVHSLNRRMEGLKR